LGIGSLERVWWRPIDTYPLDLVVHFITIAVSNGRIMLGVPKSIRFEQDFVVMVISNNVGSYHPSYKDDQERAENHAAVVTNGSFSCAIFTAFRVYKAKNETDLANGSMDRLASLQGKELRW
jgi:hypothetical protein